MASKMMDGVKIHNDTNEAIDVTITELIKKVQSNDAENVQSIDDVKDNLLPTTLQLKVTQTDIKSTENDNTDDKTPITIDTETKGEIDRPSPQVLYATLVEEKKTYEKIQTKVEIAKHACYTHTHMIHGCIQVGEANLILTAAFTDLVVAAISGRFILQPVVLEEKTSKEIKNRFLASHPDRTCATVSESIVSLRTNTDKLKDKLRTIKKDTLITKGNLTDEMCDKMFSLIGLASVAKLANTVILGPSKVKGLKDTMELLSYIVPDGYDVNEAETRIEKLKSIENLLIKDYIPIRQKINVKKTAQRDRLYNILQKPESNLQLIAEQSLSTPAEFPLALLAINLHLLILQELATVDPLTIKPAESHYGRSMTGSFTSFADKYSDSITHNWNLIQEKRKASVAVSNVFDTQNPGNNLLHLHQPDPESDMWVYSVIDNALDNDKPCAIYTQAFDHDPGKNPECMDEFAKLHANEMVSQLDIFLGYPLSIAKELGILRDERFITFTQFKETDSHATFCPCWPL